MGDSLSNERLSVHALDGSGAGGRLPRELLPALAGGESLHVQPPVAIGSPVSQTDDSHEAHDPPVVQFLGLHEFWVIAEITQEPVQLPESALVTVEPGADVAAGIQSGLENQERGLPAGFRSVAGGFEADDSGSIHAFDERDSFARLAEALNSHSHE
jgi:hypothetical protein